MSTSSVEPTRKIPPRPPRPPEGPLLIHTPAGPPHDSAETGPAWVRGPPPAYHLGEVGHLVEPAEVHTPATPVEPSAPATAPIRCPKCREKFEWTLERPTMVTCPHCATTGLLKANAPKL